MKVGDVHDMHNYPAPNAPPTEPDRAAVLGEFGGLGLPVTDHMWRAEKNWAYRTYQSARGTRECISRSREKIARFGWF